LICAVRNYKDQVVDKLLNYHPKDPNKSIDINKANIIDGDTALILAVTCGNDQVV